MQVVHGQLRLLKIFLSIGGRSCTEYISALSLNLMVLARHYKAKSVFWKMFSDNVSMFNEEAGEVSFSALAKGVAQGGLKKNVGQVSDHFVTMKCKMALAEELRFELNGTSVGDTRPYKVKQNSEEVTATVAFFKRLIRQSLNRCRFQYDPGLSQLRGNAEQVLYVPPATRVYLVNSSQAVEKALSKASSFLKKGELNKHPDLWPEVKVAGEAQSDNDPGPPDVQHQVAQIPDEVVHDTNVQDAVDGLLRVHDNLSNMLLQNDAADDGKDSLSSVDEEKRVKIDKQKKVKRRGNNAKKKNKKKKVDQMITVQDAGVYIGRIIKVPAWKFGFKNAHEIFADPSNSFLHMMVGMFDLSRGKEIFLCQMADEAEDQDYKLWFEYLEVCRWVIPEDAEWADTPYI